MSGQTENTFTPDSHRVAAHEAGHFMACSHFRIYADPVVFGEHDKRPASDGRLLAGECRMDKNGTPFQNAVIGWCGVLAEHVLGLPEKTLSPSFPLTKETLREFHSMAMCNFERLSLGDQLMIAEYKPSCFLPFKTAFRILTRNKSKLRRLASMLTNQAETAMEPVPEYTIKFSPQDRAVLLEKHLAGLKQDDPDRERLARILEHLKRGEEPPVDLVPTAQQPGGEK
jgi:hypothetical protein